MSLEDRYQSSLVKKMSRKENVVEKEAVKELLLQLL
jgi:hypothetical protein